MGDIKEVAIDKSFHVKKGYINAAYKNVMNKVGIGFLFIYFVLPQYFGVDLPFFDFTAQRIAIVFAFLVFVEKSTRMRQFAKIVKECSLLPLIAVYLFILLYTAITRKHMGTFLYSFIEFVAFFMVVYFIKEVLGVSRTVQLIIYFSYLLCILGIVEYGIGRSLFSYMETIPGLYTGAQVRSGSYRIMGPCNHALGYGLVLGTMIPFCCYDEKKQQLDMTSHWPLLFLVILNILLTGSRSTLAVCGLELVMFFLVSSREKKRKIILAVAVLAVVLAGVTVLTIRTSFGRYIMLQITSVIDEIFGTSFAVRFGADTRTLGNSATYRDLLLDIFHVNWLNPWLGMGAGYVFYWYHNGFSIKSIDNFYVANYIRYGYPGMISYILIILFTLYKMLRKTIENHSALCLCMFIGTVCYFVNLWWLDTLQTIKYVYILFAFYYTLESMEFEKEAGKKKSRYLK